jgi:hypothetical protein
VSIRIEQGPRPVSVASEVGERLWVLIVAGIPVGVVVAGAGSRVAMLVLRLTSPDHVRGVTSDDGFEIGRFTLGGTYNLLLLGAAVGMIGAAAYRAVAPWLLGPVWFRRCTVGTASGVVVGSMLVHSDGIDFHALKPLWLAVGLFVALPAVFGAAIAHAVDRLALGEWPPGRRRWVLPALLVVAFPLVIPIVMIAAIMLTLWVPIRRAIASSAGMPTIAGLAIRSGWAAVAVLGLVALVRDVQALT